MKKLLHIGFLPQFLPWFYTCIHSTQHTLFLYMTNLAPHTCYRKSTVCQVFSAFYISTLVPWPGFQMKLRIMSHQTILMSAFPCDVCLLYYGGLHSFFLLLFPNFWVTLESVMDITARVCTKTKYNPYKYSMES